MANYDVDTHTETFKTLALCAAGFNTKLETIDNTKTIRHAQIFKDGNGYAYILTVNAA
jgi:hypothetical protein|tara:strand:- start:2228 stop:2401 length:174 start_codon:yes stop_codon:yes gene_type:complete